MMMTMMLMEEVTDVAGGEGGAGGGVGTAAAAEAGGGFDFRALANERGEFVEGWQDRLPAQFDASRATLANYRSFDKLAEAFMENKRAAMTRTEGMIRLPGKEAKPEEISEFHKALGVPGKPEEYGLKQPENLPPGTEWNPEFADAFAGAAHKLGLTKAQVEGLSAWHLQETVGRMQNVEVEGQRLFEQEQSELRRIFGGDYDKRMVDARRAAMTLGLPDDHPVFYRADSIKAMARLADLISEDRLISPTQVQNKLSPETAARDVMTNPDHPDYKAYYDPAHGRHREVVAWVNGQMKRAYGG
ncbi:hypothetical protein [Verrucomicrobium sp. BvORR106]|uniref:hypothetical protein n=1 Tax=Verrucomicrobium sp. BvORR106 TaxID=1403819 RepID=UPI00056DF033|nr:hypothetical protein [Verrucomicrobium sp. BvORR106]